MTTSSTRREARRKPPLAILLLAVVGVLFLLIPVVSLIFATAWAQFPSHIFQPQSLVALRLSLFTSITSTVIAFAIGVPLAWLLARVRFAGRRFVAALVALPLVLPPVVGGIALLLAFGRRGSIGHWLYEAFGLQLTFSTAGVILAETFVAMPFLIITVESALRSSDARLEEAALVLGATRLQVLRRITLPLIKPALIAGGVLCWARALGEFGATITFAGSFPGTTQTLPLAVYGLLDTDRDAAIAMSLVMLALSVIVLVVLRDRFLRTGFMAGADRD